MSTNIISVLIISIKIVLALLSLILLISCFKSMKNRVRGKSALIILQNAQTKQEFPVFYWENSLGRSKNCDIVIDDTAISRDHAVLFRRKEGWFVSDTHSKSGVFVKGQKIKNKVKINLNDTISLGSTTLSLKKASDSREISSFSETEPSSTAILVPPMSIPIYCFNKNNPLIYHIKLKSLFLNSKHLCLF